MPQSSLYSRSFSRVVGHRRGRCLGGVRARNIRRCVSRRHRACGASWLVGCGACGNGSCSWVTITRDTIFHGTVTGDVTVLGGVHLDLLGTVLGNLLVEDSGTACVRGVVAEAVINRGGVVEIYGSVGSITGTERTQMHRGSKVES